MVPNLPKPSKTCCWGPGSGYSQRNCNTKQDPNSQPQKQKNATSLDPQKVLGGKFILISTILVQKSTTRVVRCNSPLPLPLHLTCPSTWEKKYREHLSSHLVGEGMLLIITFTVIFIFTIVNIITSPSTFSLLVEFG